VAGKRRNQKLKEGRGCERSIPTNSKLLAQIKTMLLLAANRDDERQIWLNDYKPTMETWCST